MTTTELEQLEQSLQKRLEAQQYMSMNAVLSVYKNPPYQAVREYQERCQIYEQQHAIREVLRSRPDGATNRAWGIYPDAQ